MKRTHGWGRLAGGRRPLGAVGAVLAIALLAACSSKNNATKKSAQLGPATPTPTPAAAQPTVTKPTFSKAPSITIDPTKGYIADMKTDKGDIIIQLNAQQAPLTVNNFVFLAEQHYYDGLTCQRVIPNFVAQCGSPNGTDVGGPGYTIPDERNALTHVTGAVAMAKAGPNTAGSQFYIVLAPQPQLNGQYTVFGQVTQGMNVAESLTPRNPDQNPTTPGDRIISITITETDVTPTPVNSIPTVPATPAP